MSRDEEVEACFKENPQLLEMSLKQLGLYFFIQGELSNSRAREAAENLYFQALRFISDEDKKRLKGQLGSLYRESEAEIKKLNIEEE